MENNTGKFLAGYAMEDLTPDYSVPLVGFGNSWRRMSETILSHIICQCTAMVDEKGTALKEEYDAEQNFRLLESLR